MRKLLIAGNWKMNTLLDDAQSLAEEVAHKVSARDLPSGVETAVCPPFVNLATVRAALVGSSVLLGAQNASDKASGAYTGEVSAQMLAAAGCSVVILGHSERRQYFGEDDALVNAKCRAAQAAGLRPIVCVGERLEEREQGKQNDVVAAQVRGSLSGLKTEGPTAPVIAYEPVWAIGTGRTATPDQAQDMHAFIRSLLRDLWSPHAADATGILYGGSMKPDNAKELLGQADIDGGLIGGASLDASAFLAIIQAAVEVAYA